MENITLEQISTAITYLIPIVTVIGVLFKIYNKMVTVEKKVDLQGELNKVNLSSTKVILDYFIADKIGNGEFKAARQKIDEVLIEKTS